MRVSCRHRAPIAGLVVGLVSDDDEALVEADLDHASVVEPDLDAVRGAVVADLGLDDRTATGVLERSGRGAFERRAAEGLLTAASSGRDRDAGREPADGITTAVTSTSLRLILTCAPPVDRLRVRVSCRDEMTMRTIALRSEISAGCSRLERALRGWSRLTP